jgi:hypothetical protein
MFEVEYLMITIPEPPLPATPILEAVLCPPVAKRFPPPPPPPVFAVPLTAGESVVAPRPPPPRPPLPYR